MITGGTLEIYPEPDGPADTALMDVVAANAVDFIKLTPSHLSLLRRIGLEGSRLCRMVVGGEDLKTSLAAAISAELHGRIEIYNEYGPTEAVVGCMIHRYDPATDTAASVPIGLPADHVEVAILNEALSSVPEGVAGELWIERFGLARGYHGLEELTAERFQPHPRRRGARRYRTGDRVRLVEPDKLLYLGRIDRQLKISGFRVEPGEVEATLLSLPGVEECAVIARGRRTREPEASETIRHCIHCGLPSNYPRAGFDETGVCSVCRSYEVDKGATPGLLQDDGRPACALRGIRARPVRSTYDCMMLYSGGKDSTYALCRLVEMGLSVYAFTLDNGFIAEGAKDNIRRVTEKLGVPVEFATTSAMNAIFRDSLMRFANVCNGCFKTIYTLSLQRARELSIPIIVTGLSRGQMFETRLTEEMFRDGRRLPEEIDAAVLAARKVYHRSRRRGHAVARRHDLRGRRDLRASPVRRLLSLLRRGDGRAVLLSAAGGALGAPGRHGPVDQLQDQRRRDLRPQEGTWLPQLRAPLQLGRTPRSQGSRAPPSRSSTTTSTWTTSGERSPRLGTTRNGRALAASRRCSRPSTSRRGTCPMKSFDKGSANVCPRSSSPFTCGGSTPSP